MTQTIIAGFEGATILARIDQSERSLLDVVETLARVIAMGAPG